MKKIITAMFAAIALALVSIAPAHAARVSEPYPQDRCSAYEVEITYEGGNVWSLTNRGAEDRNYLVQLSLGEDILSSEVVSIPAGGTVQVNGATSDPSEWIGVVPGDNTDGCLGLAGPGSYADYPAKGKGKGNRK